MNRYETIYDRTLEWAYGLNDGKPLNTVEGVWKATFVGKQFDYRIVINAHPEYTWFGNPQRQIAPFEMIVYPSSKLVASFAPIIIAGPNGVSLWKHDEARLFSQRLDKVMYKMQEGDSR